MTKVTSSRSKTIVFITALVLAYVLTGCGNEEDFYLDPHPPTSTHSSFQHNSGLSMEDSIIGEGNAKYQFEQYPTLDLIHPSKLGKVFGTDPLILDADEILPPRHEPLEKLPAPNFWHPEDDQDDSSSQTPIIEQDFTPVATPFNKTRPIDQLTEVEFGLVCKAVDQLYESHDLTSLNVGGCAYDIAYQNIDFTRLDDNACGRYMDNCLSQHRQFELPIGLCHERLQPPETCEVNYAQLQSCIQAVNDTQIDLAEEDICDAATDDITRTRVLLNQHNKARKCLTKLASHCPAIAPHDDE